MAVERQIAIAAEGQFLTVGQLHGNCAPGAGNQMLTDKHAIAFTQGPA